jgi:hypothetical protein
MQFLEMLLDWRELRITVGLDAVIYAVMALVGTALFLLRLIMSLLLGLDNDGFDTDLDHGGGGFPLISLLSLTSFFMGAGWMGLVARIDWGLSPTPAAFAAAGFGFAMMVLAASLMFGAKKLQQDVTYDLKTAIGKTGQVYMSIPPRGDGAGQVRVSASGRLMTINAISTGPAIEAFKDVTVTEVRDDKTIIVQPVDE